MRIEAMPTVSMEHTAVFVVVVALVLLHHQGQGAAAADDVNSTALPEATAGTDQDRPTSYTTLAEDTVHSLIMQRVRERHVQRFSYCLVPTAPRPEDRHGVLRFGNEIPSTANMRRAEILYNAHRLTNYGPYYVELVGVSVAGRRLPGIDGDTFRRNETSGAGGTVIDVGLRGMRMVPAAGDALVRAVEEHLRPLGLPVVRRAGFSFCVRGATTAVWRSLPTVTLHFRDPGAELMIVPAKLFGVVSQDTCLGVYPGTKTVIGAAPQVNTRFTFDVMGNTVYFAPEQCDRDTGVRTT